VQRKALRDGCLLSVCCTPCQISLGLKKLRNLTKSELSKMPRLALFFTYN
jgi:hypothetical protein